MHVSTWSPNDPEEWLAVHQWTPENHMIEAEIAKVQYSYFRDKLNKALESLPRREVGYRVFLAMWGDPLNRVWELWIPLSADVSLGLLSKA